MSIDAVALVRIPGWEPSEDLDVRELDDGFLVYTELAFDSDADEILDGLDDLVGDAIEKHDDPRGIFVLPDAAEPEDATTYEAVIAAVGELGVWISDASLSGGVEPELEQPDAAGFHMGQMNEMLSALGMGDLESFARAMQEGDKESLFHAQLKMQDALQALADPEKIAQAVEAQKALVDAKSKPDK